MTPNPTFKVTLSDTDSAMLRPASIDRAQSGKASLLKHSDATLSPSMPDLNTRSTSAVLRCLGGANHHLRQRDNTGDRDRVFSPDFSGCVAGRLLGVEGGDGSWGSVGDEGGDDVTGPRSAGIKDDVEAASDARAVLGARASDMLDFGGIGLNCKSVMSRSATR
jgi:hypothetical protein